jgi:hypothetical protein
VGTVLGNVGALITAIKAIPLFFEGTEDTGTGGKIDQKGGFLSVLHPNERVLTAKQNASLTGLGNEELSQIGTLYKQGLLTSKIDTPDTWQSNQQVLRKFDDLQNAVNSINITQQHLSFDSIRGYVIETIQKEGSTKRYMSRRGRTSRNG